MGPSASVRPLCSVRACGQPLACDPLAWTCPRGHSFDVARSGYVNLLQPGDRRSRVAGDAREAGRARERLEERGVGEELRASIEEHARSLGLGVGAAVLDVGAGSGAQLERLRAGMGVEGWALDLSTDAVERGARRFPALHWIVANADRRLPFAPGSFALVLSSVGPKNPAEFRRVLAPGGALLLVVPAPDDLIELRAAVQSRGEHLDRVPATLERFAGAFTCAGRRTVRTRRELDRAELDDLLAATYRGARRSERERAAALTSLETTLAAEVLHLVPR